jgi:RNA polymerase sigma factor (sigma-70 family)
MPPVLDETRLAHAAAAGDGEAFSQLYEVYEGRIYNFCLRICGSQEDAADATQDAFVKVLQRLPKLKGRDLNFGAYLFTAARNASYDVIGKRKKADAVDEIPETGVTPLLADERAAAVQEPEKAAMVGALQVQVQAANAQLPERQREVLALREVEELSYDEIAEIMEMNRNSVAQLISRARINLRDVLVGDALASIATTSKACERALPLIAMQQDGQLKNDKDADWLDTHLADCETCKVAVEAMSEAGLSYRAWAPVVPLAWLWKDTMAKAAEATNSDWADLIERGRRKQTDAGSGGSTGGAGSAAAASSGARRRRLRLGALAGVGAVLLTLLIVSLVIGKDDPPQPSAEAAVVPAITTPLPGGGGNKTETATTETTITQTTVAVPTLTTPAATPSGKKKKGKTKTTPATTTPATTVTPTPTPPPVALGPCSGMTGTALAVCCRKNPGTTGCGAPGAPVPLRDPRDSN